MTPHSHRPAYLFLAPALAVALCFGRASGLAISAPPQDREPDPFKERQAVIVALSSIERDHIKDLAWIRKAAVEAKRAEETASPAPATWAATAAVRTRIHGSVLGLLEKHDRRMRGAVASLKLANSMPDARQRFAHSGLQIVAQWIGIDAPHRVRRAITDQLPTIAADLAHPQDPKLRRRLLATIADRLCETPFRTDLEDLCELLGWAALLHGALPPGPKQLQSATADLIVVLTERDESGVQPSHLDYYRSGRFQDSGFGQELHDGSDQVRHFIWAIRAMVRSPDFAATEQILNLKERTDSVTRKVPIEKADLALNHRAREIAEVMFGAKKGVKKSERVPRPIRDLPDLVGTTLRR